MKNQKLVSVQIYMHLLGGLNLRYLFVMLFVINARKNGYMNIIFGYLDRIFTVSTIKTTLAKSALNLYEKNFFEKIEIDV